MDGETDRRDEERPALILFFLQRALRMARRISMRKKLFIFDLDGTLVNAYPAIEKSFNYAMSLLGYPQRSRDVIRRAVGHGDVQLLAPFVKKSALDRATSIYRRHHARHLSCGVRWLPYARRFLDYLKKRGSHTAIASNRPTRFTRLILKSLRAESLFDRVLCADHLVFKKPHPLILNRLMKELGVLKKEAVYVGDMALDVETACRARVDMVAVATGSSSLAELKKRGKARVIKDLKFLNRLCLKGLY